MTWTYDAATVATSDLSKVRYLVGDTNSNDKLQQDEEIAFALSERGTIYGAAAMVCRAVAAKFSRDADVSDRDLRTSYSQRAASFLRMAAQYEDKAGVTESGPAVLVAGLPSSFAQ